MFPIQIQEIVSKRTVEQDYEESAFMGFGKF